MFQRRLYVLILFVSLFFLAFVFLICSVVIMKKGRNEPNIYKLMAYENNVALYRNEELILVYDEIVLNSLPEYDQESFKKGIIVSEINKIDEIIEDYE